MIRISVITCTYNAADVLQRTLDSVAEQTFEGIEHIIMDGLSRDGTAEMARRYAEAEGQRGRGRSVTVVSERDGGLYDAMNKGIERATGGFLVFLNAGDKLHSKDTLRIVAETARKSGKAAVVYGDTDIVDAEGAFLRRRRLSPPERLTWRSFMRGMLVCHQSFYVRADLARFEPYNLRYRYSADVDWCIRIMKRAERNGMSLVNTHAVLTDYLDGGMSVKNHRASLSERFRIMRRHYGLCRTVFMHLWFVVRMIAGKLSSKNG